MRFLSSWTKTYIRPSKKKKRLLKILYDTNDAINRIALSYTGRRHHGDTGSGSLSGHGIGQHGGGPAHHRHYGGSDHPHHHHGGVVGLHHGDIVKRRHIFIISYEAALIGISSFCLLNFLVSGWVGGVTGIAYVYVCITGIIFMCSLFGYGLSSFLGNEKVLGILLGTIMTANCLYISVVVWDQIDALGQSFQFNNYLIFLLTAFSPELLSCWSVLSFISYCMSFLLFNDTEAHLIRAINEANDDSISVIGGGTSPMQVVSRMVIEPMIRNTSLRHLTDAPVTTTSSIMATSSIMNVSFADGSIQKIMPVSLSVSEVEQMVGVPCIWDLVVASLFLAYSYFVYHVVYAMSLLILKFRRSPLSAMGEFSALHDLEDGVLCMLGLQDHSNCEEEEEDISPDHRGASDDSSSFPLGNNLPCGSINKNTHPMLLEGDNTTNSSIPSAAILRRPNYPANVVVNGDRGGNTILEAVSVCLTQTNDEVVSPPMEPSETASTSRLLQYVTAGGIAGHPPPPQSIWSGNQRDRVLTSPPLDASQRPIVVKRAVESVPPPIKRPPRQLPKLEVPQRSAENDGSASSDTTILGLPPKEETPNTGNNSSPTRHTSVTQSSSHTPSSRRIAARGSARLGNGSAEMEVSGCKSKQISSHRPKLHSIMSEVVSKGIAKKSTFPDRVSKCYVAPDLPRRVSEAVTDFFVLRDIVNDGKIHPRMNYYVIESSFERPLHRPKPKPRKPRGGIFSNKSVGTRMKCCRSASHSSSSSLSSQHQPFSHEDRNNHKHNRIDSVSPSERSSLLHALCGVRKPITSRDPDTATLTTLSSRRRHSQNGKDSHFTVSVSESTRRLFVPESACGSIVELLKAISERIFVEMKIGYIQRKLTVFSACQTATTSIAPKQHFSGVFSCQTMETWYCQWLQAYTPKVIRFMRRIHIWTSLLLFLHAVSYLLPLVNRVRLVKICEDYGFDIGTINTTQLLETGYVIVGYRTVMTADPKINASKYFNVLIWFRLLSQLLINLSLCLTTDFDSMTAWAGQKAQVAGLKLIVVQQLYGITDLIFYYTTIASCASMADVPGLSTVYAALACIPVFAPTARLPILVAVSGFTILVCSLVMLIWSPSIKLFCLCFCIMLGFAVTGVVWVSRSFDRRRRETFSTLVLPYLIYLDGLIDWLKDSDAESVSQILANLKKMT